MHLLPVGVGVVPNACLATSCGDGCAVNEFLRQARVADNNRVIAEPAQMGTSHGHGHRWWCADLTVAGQIKVVTVKSKAFHQVAFAFRLKATDVAAAELGVLLPIALGDTVEHGLVNGKDLLIALRQGHAKTVDVERHSILLGGRPFFPKAVGRWCCGVRNIVWICLRNHHVLASKGCLLGPCALRVELNASRGPRAIDGSLF